MSVYMINLPFNHFENKYVIIAYQILHSEYKSSHHKFVAKSLLNETYKIVKLKINVCLNVFNHFNFFTDETVNIRKKKVINLCCHVFFEDGFHIKIDVKIVEIMNATMQTN